MSTAAPLPDSLVVRGARVLALDDADHDWPCADIVVEQGRIVAIGPEAAAGWPRPVQREIDGRGLLAMPGLVNGHFHSPGNLMKGRLPGYPLEVFMLHEVPPLAGSAASARLSHLCTLAGALQMLRKGVTAVHDDAYHVPAATPASVDAICSAYEAAGLRATVAIDQPNVVEYDKYPYLAGLLPEDERRAMAAAPRQSTDELLAVYAHLVARWHGAANGRLRAAVSCSAPQRVTPDYLGGLSALSRTHGLPFNVHLLETKLQRVLGREKYGRSLIRLLHEHGALDERVLAIHAIWVDEADVALLAGSGCTVAHNPVCNLRLGSGVMPWQMLKDAGVPMCLGSDEMCSDDSVNLWFVAKTAALLHTLWTPDHERWPQPGEILAMATRGGARGMGRADTLGFLAPGCDADLVLLDLQDDAFWPLNDLRRQLVHCQDGSGVRMTIVAGRVVCEDGRVAGIDEPALRAELRELMAESASLLRAAGTDAARLEPHYRAMVEQAAAQDVGLTRRLG